MNAITAIEMTAEEWIRVPPNPRQRNTIMHARSAKYLLTPQPTHLSVAAARLPDGQLVKIDGHTRAYLWQTRAVQPPPKVLVNVYPVQSIAEAEHLCQMYDSLGPVKTFKDLMYSATKAFGMELRCRWLWNTLSSALGLLELTHSVRERLDEVLLAWRGEIMEVASWNIEMPGLLIRGSVTAPLLLCSMEPTTKGFAIALAEKRGLTIDGRSDAVEATIRMMELAVAAKKTQGANVYDLAGKVYSAIQGWKEGKKYSGPLRGTPWQKVAQPRVFRR